MHRSIGKKTAAGLTLAGLLLYQLWVPLVAAAQSRADFEQRIRDLERKLERLERLQGEGAAPAAAPAAEPPIDEERVKAIAQDEIKKTRPLAGWKDGFYLESRDGDFKLKLRGLIQADARWFPNASGDDGTSAFFLRRVRPTFEGTVYKYFDYKIMPDFGGSGSTSISPSLQDAYVDIKYFPYARFRAGKYKTPFSLERLQSGANLIFIERSLAQNIPPNRDVGFMLHGDPFSNGVLCYELGLFNGTVEAARSTATSTPTRSSRVASSSTRSRRPSRPR